MTMFSVFCKTYLYQKDENISSSHTMQIFGLKKTQMFVCVQDPDTYIHELDLKKFVCEAVVLALVNSQFTLLKI